MKVIIWSKDDCPYCDMAKNWFKSKNVVFTERKIGTDGVTKEQLLEAIPSARSVPQIIIDDTVIGGWDNLRKSEYFNG